MKPIVTFAIDYNPKKKRYFVVAVLENGIRSEFTTQMGGFNAEIEAKRFLKRHLERHEMECFKVKLENVTFTNEEIMSL